MKVLITDRRHASIEEERKVFEPLGVQVVDQFCEDEDDLIENGKGALGFLVSYARITERVMRALPELKIIVKYGVGVDNIDLKAASRLGKYVANVPDYCVEEVALQALSLLLNGVRRTCFFAGEVCKGHWVGDPEQQVIYRLSSHNLGLVGFGRIARKLAFFMRNMVNEIYFYDPYVTLNQLPKEEVEKCHQVSSLGDIFSLCKLISIHLPLTLDTQGVIDRRCFNLANGAVVVNTSRGGVIERRDLEDALDAQRVIFYGADVFWEEPPDFSNPENLKFLSRKNVLITPHVGWYSEESEKEVRRKAAEEVARVIRGEKPLNWVNRDF
jgi:D-3-phosphoglycerate dehydrogenase